MNGENTYYEQSHALKLCFFVESVPMMGMQKNYWTTQQTSYYMYISKYFECIDICINNHNCIKELYILQKKPEETQRGTEKPCQLY